MRAGEASRRREVLVQRLCGSWGGRRQMVNEKELQVRFLESRCGSMWNKVREEEKIRVCKALWTLSGIFFFFLHTKSYGRHLRWFKEGFSPIYMCVLRIQSIAHWIWLHSIAFLKAPDPNACKIIEIFARLPYMWTKQFNSYLAIPCILF